MANLQHTDDYDSSLAVFGVEDDGLMEAIHNHLHMQQQVQKRRKSPSPPPKESGGMAFYPCPPPEDQEYSADIDIVKTSMYGRYTKDLSSYAKSEARRLDRVRRESLAEVGLGKKQKKTVCGNSRFAVWLAWLWKHSFARLGEDWVFLALLGVIMAVLSFIMDRGISMCNHARIWLYEDFEKNDVVAAYFAWVTLPVILVLFSAGFVQIVAPQSIGSGIPEMKTILRGVALKEYLTFRTLVAKSVGLTTTLGSGMPLGKEGPFVHIASIAATLLSKLVTSFQNIYENESRNCEMLAAACAVGVASCFAAPIGGVLFSIEVTTVYFAVRNYWRAFFAAVCGATVFRLLAVWFNEATTVTAVFRTDFAMENPFDPQELFIFALMGVLCGLGGAFYVWAHRQYVLFMRSSKTLNNFLQKNRFLYPGIVALLVSSVSFHNGLGQYIAGKLTSHDQLHHLFSNFTWTKENITARESETLDNWTTEDTNVFVTLFGFTLYTFVFSIICSTLPVPSGSFIPVFKIGAAVGRAIGEAVHLALPTIVFANQRLAPIIPGGYATVGAAAFSGAVTHTISVSVIVFEITGQITHIIPMMLSVLISNAVASFLQPSIYDSIILIKKLPYLPDLLPSSSGIYNIYVENFMVKDVKYIWKGMTYKDLKNILKETKKLRSFPLVDSPDSMILLGSVQRLQLIGLIEKQIGRDRRLEVAAKLQQERINKERERKQLEQKQRRPSRFEVTPAPDILKLQPNYHHPVFGGQPKKSILKKTNSFTLKGFSPLAQTSPNSTPYTTVTGAESRIRLAFEAIFKKSSTLQDVEPTLGESQNLTATLTDSGVKPQILRNSTSPSGTMQSGQLTSTANKKVTLPRERVCDMSPEEQVMWQDAELAKSVEFTCNVDPAPFQLVERTSLLKVHSLFSMVGVNHAYVTACGKLVGVVALKELRKAIEDANSGNLPVHKDNENVELNCTSPLMTTSDKNQSTITSMDSAVSTNTVNSDNQSMDIEMDIRSPPPLPPKPTKVQRSVYSKKKSKNG